MPIQILIFARFLRNFTCTYMIEGRIFMHKISQAYIFLAFFLLFFTFFLVCCGCDTSYIVSVHIQCQASIYTLMLCCGHSWRVRLAKQETLTPPEHLVSPLVCRGPWMSSVVLYCWCHSDSASVLFVFYICVWKAVHNRTFWIILVLYQQWNR